MVDEVFNVIFVYQHKTVVDVSAKNKKTSSVFVSEKCQLAEQQNQVGNLPTVVAAHSDAICLLINVLSRNKKVSVVNKILQIK